MKEEILKEYKDLVSNTRSALDNAKYNFDRNGDDNDSLTVLQRKKILFDAEVSDIMTKYQIGLEDIKFRLEHGIDNNLGEDDE